MTDPFSGESAGHPWIPFTKETLLWGLYTLLLTRSISYMTGDWRWHNAYVTSLYVDKRGFCRPQSLHFLHEIREYHTVYTIYISLRWNAQPSLQWRHNEHDGASNHQPRDCLLNRLFRCRSKETSKLRVTGLCEGNSPVTGEFPAQRASNAENVSIWWRHHAHQKDWVPSVQLIAVLPYFLSLS